MLSYQCNLNGSDLSTAMLPDVPAVARVLECLHWHRGNGVYHYFGMLSLNPYEGRRLMNDFLLGYCSTRLPSVTVEGLSRLV